MQSHTRRNLTLDSCFYRGEGTLQITEQIFSIGMHWRGLIRLLSSRMNNQKTELSEGPGDRLLWAVYEDIDYHSIRVWSG